MSLTAIRHPDELRAALVRAWRAWDAAPANKQAAIAFEFACSAYAGAASNELRRYLAAAARAGMTRPDALEAWEADW